MKKSALLIIVFIAASSLKAQNNTNKLLETHFEARLSTMFDFNINSVLKDNLITPFKPVTYGLGYNYFYLPKKIGLYGHFSWNMNFSTGENTSNTVNWFSASIGPLFNVVEKNSFKLYLSPYYSYQTLSVD